MWLKRHYLNSSSTLKQQRSPNHLTGPLSAAWLSCHFLIAPSHLWVSENLYWPDFSSVHPSPFPSFTYSTCVSQGSILSCHLILYNWISKAKWYTGVTVSSVQSLSHVWLFATPWTAACQASLSITNSRSLLKLMSIESVMPSNCLILCHPLLLPPSIFPSIRVFSNESVLHIRWPKYWSFSFSISPSNEYSGLISFRMG